MTSKILILALGALLLAACGTTERTVVVTPTPGSTVVVPPDGDTRVIAPHQP
jgi:uncharacterized lipoprotein YajG